MSEQTQDLVNQLELRIKELTEANHQLQRHATHLEAAAQLDQTVTSAMDMATFSKQAVKKIKGLFGLYHVGVYLIDTSGQWAVLNQAAGKASRKLMQEKYQLPLDDVSSIGWVSKNQKPYLSYSSRLTGGEDRAFSITNHLLPGAKSELALPLVANQGLLGVLDIQSIEEKAFDQEDITAFGKLANQIAIAIEKLQQPQTADFGSDEAKLLYDVGVSLSSNLDIDDILTKTINLAGRIGATLGEIYLLTDTSETHFKSSISKRNNLDNTKQKELVHRVLSNETVAQILETNQMILASDAKQANQWYFLELEEQPGSIICAPIIVEQWRLKGVILFVHAEFEQFNQKTLLLLEPIISQITSALRNSVLLEDMQSNLRETHLMLDISRSLAAVSSFEEIFDALEQSILAAGANRCILYTCNDLDNNNIPRMGQIVFVSGPEHPAKDEVLNNRFPLKTYETLDNLVHTQETLVVTNIETDERLSEEERTFFRQFGAGSFIINPLVTGSHISGLLAIEYQSKHSFTHRELAIYRTLCNHTTTAIDRALQIQRTEEALAETQTLYRTGRVLAGADDLQEILQEALVEFVHSFGLDQGGITLLTSDKQFGQLRAYLEKSQIQDAEKLRFPINHNIVYQKLLLSGQPFYSLDVANDTRLVEFHGFNKDEAIKSTLQVPIIIRGETVGWIGVDAVNEPRDFTQKDIDLARALGDQIAISIQNHWLLEQTERRAEQLKAVANVGEVVTGLMDLNEVLNSTVDLIRDRFGFYHVSIFLLDEHREWAVVRASTGRVGKIMVERPHRLAVGSNSIVGFATENAMPRIALDVGEDAVHFENPLLPDTRSEIALPLLSRGVVIGALDVQSGEPNAFTNEDVETLQIMANQITTAIENARLFEQIQRRLNEQAMLYRIGTKIGGTLQLQETTDILVLETAEALDVAECVLTLIEEGNTTYIISNYVKEGSPLESGQGIRRTIEESTGVDEILRTKQEVIIHIDDPDDGSWAFEYLRTYHGTALIIVPVLLRNEVIGLLEVYDDTPGRLFTQEDVALLDSIALQAANAIENAQLFEQAQSMLRELTLAEEELEKFKLGIERANDAVFLTDIDGTIVYVNPAFEKIYGYTQEEVLGQTPRILKSGLVSQEVYTQFWETLLAKETVVGELINKTKDGRYLNIEGSSNPVLDDNGNIIGFLAIQHDITERKQAEKALQKALERTRALYHIGDTLATATNQQNTFEIVLGEYLQLLGLKQGSIMLFNKATNTNMAQARFIDGEAVTPNLELAIEDDLVFQHLQKEPTPFIIENPKAHLLTKDSQETRGQQHVTAMLFIPLVIREEVIGSIALDVTTEEGYVFSQDDINTGESIADQLTIWLENRRLLTEAQFRLDRLQTAADVSRAASSILDADELIETSVNLIRNRFNFYYVGLFLVDEAREWAVLRAGTGEAGRIQLERNHRLKIGGGSMIGWSIDNRSARIALDVGEEAVHFKRNPILPDTHSEMALPLISRDQVLGALTVQSVERAAFSSEDITQLQTMADQLANAIENANLFTQTQEALAEAEALYQITQQLTTAPDEETVYQLAIKAIAESEVDSSGLYMYLEAKNQDDISVPNQIIEQKAVWTAIGTPAMPNGTRLRAADFVIEPFLPRYDSILVADINNSSKITDQLRTILTAVGITSLLILPLSTQQRRLGFLLVAYKTPEKQFTQKQIRFFTTIAQQLVTTLENLRLLDASQKRAQREEIIREITLKIRNAIDIDDILKTTVTELGKVLGTSRGNIVLDVGALPTQTQARLQASNGSQNKTASSDNVANGSGTKTVGDKENQDHGE